MQNTLQINDSQLAKFLATLVLIKVKFFVKFVNRALFLGLKLQKSVKVSTCTEKLPA